MLLKCPEIPDKLLHLISLLKMNSGGPPGPPSGGFGGQDEANNGTTGISTEAAVSALEQHDSLFHRQVMHLRQQQVIPVLSPVLSPLNHFTRG